jgi:histidinol phosphatase-like PHP family hydrolase
LRADADFRRQAMAAYDRGRLRHLAAKAAEREIAFEIKPPLAAAFPDFHAELVGLGAEAGTRFSIGSDAHQPKEVGFGGPEEMAAAGETLDAIGLREKDLFDPMTARRRRGRAAAPSGCGPRGA